MTMPTNTTISPNIVELEPTINTELERVKSAKLSCELVGDTRIELSIKEANALLQHKTFKAERDVNTNHVQELYDEMAGGRFRPEHVNIAIVYLTGECYRVNGQHTCWARTFMPANYACKVRLLTYQVTTEEDLRKLYSVFDPQFACRTNAHLMKVLIADTNAAGDTPLSMLSLVASGFRFWKWGDNRSEYRRKGPAETNAAIQQNVELFQSIANFCVSHQEGHVKRRQAVVAAMFETMERKPSFFAEFWEPVCSGLNLSDKNDARYAIMRWLQDHTVECQNKTAGKRLTNSEEMYRIIILAWNRWRDGEKVTGAFRVTQRRMRAN